MIDVLESGCMAGNHLYPKMLQGFYAKIIHSEDNGGFYLEEELAAISKRAAICFTLGMRFFYAIIPLVNPGLFGIARWLDIPANSDLRARQPMCVSFGWHTLQLDTAEHL